MAHDLPQQGLGHHLEVDQVNGPACALGLSCRLPGRPFSVRVAWVGVMAQIILRSSRGYTPVPARCRSLVIVEGLVARLLDQAVAPGRDIVALDHLAHQFGQRRHRRPAQLALGLARIAE